MTPARMLSVGLGLVCGIALVGLLLLTLLLPGEISVPANQDGGASDLPSTADIRPAPEQVALGQYTAMAERPLFAPDRSPFIPPEPEEQIAQESAAENKPPPELEAIVLGIFVTPEKKLVSLWMPPSETTRTFREGEYLSEPLDQWRVDEIKSKQVIFAAPRANAKRGLNIEVYDGELGRSQGRSGSGGNAGAQAQAQANTEASERDPASMTPEERRELIRKRIAEARARRQAEQNREDN